MHRSIACLALVLVGLLDATANSLGGGAAAADGVGDDTAVQVARIAELIHALQDQSVTDVLLTDSVRFEQAPDLSVLPIRLDRDVTVRGPVEYKAAAEPIMAQPGVPHLDFSHLWPVLVVGTGASLVMKDLAIKGVAPFNTTEVVRSSYPQAKALFTAPSIVAENGSQVHLERYSVSKWSDRCTPDYITQSFRGIKSLLGDNAELLWGNTTAVYGNHTLPLPLTSGSDENVGMATLHAVGPITYACQLGTFQALGAGRGGGMNVKVQTIAGLLTALQSPNVTDIVLAANRRFPFGEAPNRSVLPIRLVSKALSIAGPVSYNPVDSLGMAKPGVPHLDFSQLWPVLYVGSGSRLTLSDLAIEGVPPNNTPDLAQSNYPRAMGLGAVFPAVIVADDSLIRLERYSSTRVLERCTSEYNIRSFPNVKEIFGNQTELLSDNTTALYGRHTLPLPLASSSGVDAGIAMLQVVGPATFTCVTSAEALPGEGGGGGSLGAVAWAGIAIGSAVAVAAVTVVAFAVVRRKRSAGQRAAAGGSINLDSKLANEGGQAGATVSIDVFQRQQRDAGINSLVRVRFGGLEGLEIGGLIGRGAYGRVYRGNLRGVTVAVKVMEHTVGSPQPDGSTGTDPAAEALLLCGLSHPNIVQVYRASTLRVQGTAPSGPQSGDSEGWVTPSPRLLPPSAAESPTPIEQPGIIPDNVSLDADAPAPATHAQDMAAVNQVAFEAAAAAVSSGRCSNTASSRGSSAVGRGQSAAAVLGSGAGPLSEDSDGTASSILRSARLVTLASDPGQYETWLVLEYCEKGSLDAAMNKGLMRRPDGSRREGLLLSILVDVAEGLNYLHESGVVHMDLKPANVLLKSAGPGRLTAKLADFGLSKLLPRDKHSLVRTQTLGTVQYMPPELLAAGRLSRATDIFSFGIVMLEAWTGMPAYEEQSAAAIFFAVVHQAERPPTPPDMPPRYAELMRRCWQQQPQERPSIQEVLTNLREITFPEPSWIAPPDARIP